MMLAEIVRRQEALAKKIAEEKRTSRSRRKDRTVEDFDYPDHTTAATPDAPSGPKKSKVPAGTKVLGLALPLVVHERLERLREKLGKGAKKDAALVAIEAGLRQHGV